MKVAVITDTHMGAGNDCPILSKQMFDFYEEVLFPYMAANGINNLFHAGDFFYTRKNISVQTMADTKRFLWLLDQWEVMMTMILGNHDIVHNNSSELNAPELLLADANVSIIKGPYSDDTIDFIPWINASNEEEVFDYIEKSCNKICIGHFDILGAKFSKHGITSVNGLKPETFKHYKTVLSGHFHTKSDLGNIHYLGSPFQFNHGDWNDTKYFHVLDTETGELEAIESGCNVFHRVIVDESGQTIIPHTDSLEGKFVKVEMRLKDSKAVEKHMKEIDKLNPEKVTVVMVDSDSEAEESKPVIDVEVVGGIRQIVADYVNKLDLEDKKKSEILVYLDGKFSGTEE